VTISTSLNFTQKRARFWNFASNLRPKIWTETIPELPIDGIVKMLTQKIA